ncbi:MAG: type IV pilus twitching motility protein PilT [Candidatus Sumerlaeia bacterium]|nr:type IV pilus twitching motility protein PilT [Candidatus Sumerlaeia bacterium]
MAKIDRLLEAMMSNSASDLHMAEGQKPKYRIHGEILACDEPELTSESIQDLLSEICSTERWQSFLDSGDLDFAYALGDKARYRANYYRHANGIGAVFRLIPSRIRTLDELGMPPILRDLAQMRHGLVLVTGATGSGKSTTLAAVIDFINSTSCRNILTIEEPIEFVHPAKKSIIVQREVGTEVNSFAEALRSSVHQDLDVILVGEMRDLETISLALTAAETGVLVFGTLHTNSAPKSIDRIVDVFPVDQQAQIRTMLAESLRGICSQTLMRTKDGAGRIAAVEILVRTTAIAAAIREGQTSKILSQMIAGKSLGMQLMDDTIQSYLDEGRISGETAYLAALDKERFLKFAPVGHG